MLCITNKTESSVCAIEGDRNAKHFVKSTIRLLKKNSLKVLSKRAIFVFPF